MTRAELPTRPQTLTQVIVKTSAMTLFIAFVTFSYGIAAFGWAFPQTMGGFTDRLGAYNASGMFYARVYNRNSTPENLYRVVDRYIMAGNHENVVSFGGRFIDLEQADKATCGFCSVVNRVNAHWEQRAGSNVLNRINWANERSRIKSAYTHALIRTGRHAQSRERLEYWLVNTPDTREPNHAFIVSFLQDNRTIAGRRSPREMLAEYVENFETVFEAQTGNNPFALDFLLEAHLRLGNMAQAHEYLRLLNELL